MQVSFSPDLLLPLDFFLDLVSSLIIAPVCLVRTQGAILTSPPTGSA